MSDYEYSFSEIRKGDQRALAELDTLLEREHIRRDANLEYTVGLYDSEDRLVASGSLYANTLRCLVVDSSLQGEGLMNRVISHLVVRQMELGRSHLFLYTKPDKYHLFQDVGFYPIVETENVVFMENRNRGFAEYLDELSETKGPGKSSALVMNCNPFTCGHRYLVDRAAAESACTHVFVVSEDASHFPFEDRFRLVREGTDDLQNVRLHETKSYMISQAVFPAYFLKDDESAITAQAELDAALFLRIAKTLDITVRYVGEEPFSVVTGLYNRTLLSELPKAGIDCIEVPRLTLYGEPVSASRVRRLLHDGKIEATRLMVPKTTYDYFFSDQGQTAIEAIKKSNDVTHY